ncbi:uncharacterized protein TNCT_12541 [Trichonephila clavata]|uniref:Uncharacterized protein n=1 Tax=Trichonephila clavata TaxID=2740835 RepID=A0A8X6HQJ0_TRICU|nr:uncharacterized protein TNCT_12541 [Trichonephila clavata]
MQLPNTFLSLHQMSLCNIALQVFNEPDDRFTLDGKGHSLPNKQCAILLNQKLSSLSLPNIFKKEATALVKLVLIESYKWFQDHKPIIKSTTNLQNHFQWTLDNKIDRQKTTKAIIHDDNIDIRDRFMLACHYCFQEDVFSIGGILDDAQQNIFQGCDFNDVHVWVNWARSGEELDGDEIARDILFGRQAYFPKLEQEKRLQHLMRYCGGIWSNYHELQFYLSILDQNEQQEILKKFPFRVIEVFFDWPVQKQLFDVVDLLWPYLSEQNCGVAEHFLSYGRGVQFFSKRILVGRIIPKVQAFFTSRTRPAELRKSVPRRVLFPFAFGRMINLVRTVISPHSLSSLGL